MPQSRPRKTRMPKPQPSRFDAEALGLILFAIGIFLVMALWLPAKAGFAAALGRWLRGGLSWGAHLLALIPMAYGIMVFLGKPLGKLSRRVLGSILVVTGILMTLEAIVAGSGGEWLGKITKPLSYTAILVAALLISIGIELVMGWKLLRLAKLFFRWASIQVQSLVVRGQSFLEARTEGAVAEAAARGEARLALAAYARELDTLRRSFPEEELLKSQVIEVKRARRKLAGQTEVELRYLEKDLAYWREATFDFMVLEARALKKNIEQEQPTVLEKLSEYLKTVKSGRHELGLELPHTQVSHEIERIRRRLVTELVHLVQHTERLARGRDIALEELLATPNVTLLGREKAAYHQRRQEWKELAERQIIWSEWADAYTGWPDLAEAYDRAPLELATEVSRSLQQTPLDTLQSQLKWQTRLREFGRELHEKADQLTKSLHDSAESEEYTTEHVPDELPEPIAPMSGIKRGKTIPKVPIVPLMEFPEAISEAPKPEIPKPEIPKPTPKPTIPKEVPAVKITEAPPVPIPAPVPAVPVASLRVPVPEAPKPVPAPVPEDDWDDLPFPQGRPLESTSAVSSAVPKLTVPKPTTPTPTVPPPAVAAIRRPLSLPDQTLLEPLPLETGKNALEVAARVRAGIIDETLGHFNLRARVVDWARGPTVTRYEIQPAAGEKISRIASLSNDLARALAVAGVRIEAPVPGKSVIGLEVPNAEREPVTFHQAVAGKEWTGSTGRLPVVLGKSIDGEMVIGDLAKMPHLLVAGSTGSGKSVCINTLIASLLFKYSPDDLRFLMIDPKMVELTPYDGIPHLVREVVTNPSDAAGILLGAVAHMERRYRMMSGVGARNLEQFNAKMKQSNEPTLPHLVIIIDELADLMMTSPKEVESAIMRLAQMARATGMHLILATQRPSVDILTSLIKVNIPARIAFAVSSSHDSRTILDTVGAERLTGMGDMLFYQPGLVKPLRLQAPYISETESANIAELLRGGEFQDEFVAAYGSDFAGAPESSNSTTRGQMDFSDPLLRQAAEICIEEGQGSVSRLQRRLAIGHARAGKLMDLLEAMGIVSGHQGSKPREVLVEIGALAEFFPER